MRRRRETDTGPAIITIGASLGGAEALHVILSELGSGFPVPIAIVQHRHKTSGEMLGQLLKKQTGLDVVDAEDKMPIVGGRVYLAPADYHLLVSPGVFRLSVDEPVQYSRPSIDVLFESAADAYGKRVVGVILTGANADGAEGAAAIRKKGGSVIVQDPATAEACAMPEAALPSASIVLPLRKIGAALAARAGALTR